MQRYSLIHPRCGTAFLLWVMVIAIFVFAFFGRPVWYWLIVTRILLLPRDRRARLRADPLRRQAPGQPVLMTLLAPGLWLQRLTTREPTLDQIEVSIRALKEVLVLEDRADRTPARSKSWLESAISCARSLVPRVQREAQVTWEGNVARGSGAISARDRRLRRTCRTRSRRASRSRTARRAPRSCSPPRTRPATPCRLRASSRAPGSCARAPRRATRRSRSTRSRTARTASSRPSSSRARV